MGKWEPGGFSGWGGRKTPSLSNDWSCDFGLTAVVQIYTRGLSFCGTGPSAVEGRVTQGHGPLK